MVVVWPTRVKFSLAALSFGLLLLLSASAFANPLSAGSELARETPTGCAIVGLYNDSNIGKCTVDGITGLSRCFQATLDCCGNGVIDGPYIDGATGHLIHGPEGCEPTLDPSCRVNCSKCGDGLIDTNSSEVCDKGISNGLLNSGCKLDCSVPSCGNGILEIEGGEICDQAAFSATDSTRNQVSCDGQCRMHYCGDGIQDNGEACDGSDFIETTTTQVARTCDSQCRLHFCGDGTLDAGEDCDLASANGAVGSTCNSTCQITDECQRLEGDEFFGTQDCCVDVPKPEEKIWAAGGAGLTCVQANLMQPYMKDLYWWSNQYGSGLYWSKITAITVAMQKSVKLSDGWLADPLSLRALELYNAEMSSVLQANNWTESWLAMWTASAYVGYSAESKTAACWTCALVRWWGCFVPETLIRMADGSDRRIDQVRAGDLILNPATGKAQAVKAILESAEQEPIIEIRAEGNVLRVTQGHPMFDGQEFVRASGLLIGGQLQLEDRQLVKIDSIVELPIDPSQRVLNLTLESESDAGTEHMLIADGLVTGDLLAQKQLANRSK